MSDRTITVMVLLAMAGFYLIVPIAVSMSEIETDITASILLAAAISFYTYQDHKDRKPRVHIVRALIWFMLPAMVIMAALLVLVQDFPFVLFIPMNAILVGTIYWYIERSVPSER